MFNELQLWERAKAGELRQVVGDNRHPALTKAKEPHCTRSQIISYMDKDDNEVARVHQYLRPNGKIGASGKPDPKKLLHEGVLYCFTEDPPS